MSLLVTITTLNETYRLSSHTLEAGGYCYEGRIRNPVTLEQVTKADDTGNPIRSVPLEINNLGAFIDIITEDIWGARVTVAVDGVSETWTGKIQNWSQSSDSLLSITAVEDSKDVFKRLLPDEVIRVSEYNDATREATSTAIPIPFGGSNADPLRAKGVVVDRVNFRYLFCVGEIREIVKVWKDRAEISTGFTSYLGTSGQAVYPGFVYIEFAADPRDSAGRWPEVLIDFVGLKLDGAFSEAQSRNPARILYHLLITASSGVGGWGLGVAAGDVDLTSFNTAVTDCDTVGFKLDGSITDQRTAAVWIDQICRSCRGALSFTGGKWVFRIDKDSASAKTFTTENMLLRNIGKGASSERKNRVVVDYRLDPIEGRFLGSATREDTTSQTAIGVNEYRPQLLLVRDHTAAGIVADYLNNLEVYGELRIEFSTKDFAGVSKDSVITVTRSDLGLAAALFRVQSIKVNSGIAVIEARAYSADIFDVSAGSSPTDPPTDPTLQGLGVQAPPGAVSGLNLSTGNTVLADGTTVAYVDGTYTAGTGFLFATIEYGEGASPGSWVNVGASADGAFHIQPLKNGTLYTVRVTAKNTGGSSSPVTGTITTSTDVTAPGKPQTPVLTVYFKSIAVKCLQNATKAPDMAGFKVFRHTSDVSGSATEIGFVACSGTEESVVFLDEGTAYGATYYYWTKPVDKTGNVGAFSDSASAVTAQIAGGDMGVGSINASNLFAAGVVDGPAVAAGTITASKLYVAAPGAALNEDPAFLDAEAWTCMDAYEGYKGFSLATVTDGKVGNKVLRGSGSTGQAYDMFLSVKSIPVDPSKTYRLRGWLRKRDVATTGSVYLSVREYDAAGTTLSSNAGTYLVSAAAPTTTWTEFYGLIGPGGTAFNAATKTVRIGGIMDYNTNAGSGYELADFRLEEAIPGTLIQDGAVTSGKIVANAVISCHICAGAVTADKISVACLSALSANMGTVTAGTICSVTIRAATICASTICSSTLCAATIYSDAGCIGGWSIYAGYLRYCTPNTDMYLYPPCSVYFAQACEGSWIAATMGRNYYNGAYQNSFGFAMGGSYPFFAGGMAFLGNLTLPDSSTVAQGYGYFWAGTSTGYLKYYNGVATVCGTLYATSGTIGGYTISASDLYSVCNTAGVCVGTQLARGSILISYISGTHNIQNQQAHQCQSQFWYCSGTLKSCIYTDLGCSGSCMATALTHVQITASAYCAVYCANNQLYSYGWASVSDANQKDIWIPEYSVLPKLRTLPVYQWTYRGGHRSSRLGPLAQDFAAQFPEFSPEPEALPPLDGFLMKAVQELDLCISSLESRLANAECKLSSCA